MTLALYDVRFTLDSARDLNEIIDYLSDNASLDDAQRVADAIDRRIETLNQFPDRGSVLEEVQGASPRKYRQLLVSPYRIVYFVDSPTVEIFMIIDGRRDFQAVLAQRLISGD